MGFRLFGSSTQSNAAAEVDNATKALRTSLMPRDMIGSYRKALRSGTIAAGMTGPLPIYAMRWAPTPNTYLAAIRRIQVGIGNSATAFTAGFFPIDAFIARAFTSQYTTNIGTTGAFSSNQAKLKTAFATSAGMGAVILGTSASGLTTATKTLDTDPFASLALSVLATAGTPILPLTTLFDAPPGSHPLVLANQEGFEIQATPPATGTWNMTVSVEWDEYTASGVNGWV